MKVDFNNLRRQAVNNYERLVKKLNESKCGELDHGVFLYGHGRVGKHTLVIDTAEIQEEMDNLRMLIGSIAGCFDEGDENFKNIYEELFPEGKTMTCFNEEE